jgi:predicted transposase/invertase (TIGR01784 family)
MYDPICKFLAENYSSAFARWLLGEEITLTQLSPTELSLEPIRADAVILLQSQTQVLHLEFQTTPKPEIAFRMLDYRIRVYRRFPNKTMRQVVIYLKPSTSELVQQTSFTIPSTHHEFEVIRLWEVAPEELMEEVGLMPLATLGRGKDKKSILKEVASKIEEIENPREKSNVAAATAILAGLVLKKEIIQKLLREEIMQESVIYQDILEKGKAAGIREGKAEGKAEGLVEGEAKLVLKQLQCRFPDIPHSLSQTIPTLSLEQLEALGEALLDFSQLEDLTTWLENQGN